MVIYGVGKNTLHRAVSLRHHGFLVSSRLKTLNEGELLTESARLFHAHHGPATAKARSPVGLNLIGNRSTPKLAVLTLMIDYKINSEL